MRILYTHSYVYINKDEIIRSELKTNLYFLLRIYEVQAAVNIELCADMLSVFIHRAGTYSKFFSNLFACAVSLNIFLSVSVRTAISIFSDSRFCFLLDRFIRNEE